MMGTGHGGQGTAAWALHWPPVTTGWKSTSFSSEFPLQEFLQLAGSGKGD